jgi:hypothetical protein
MQSFLQAYIARNLLILRSSRTAKNARNAIVGDAAVTPVCHRSFRRMHSPEFNQRSFIFFVIDLQSSPIRFVYDRFHYAVNDAAGV